MTKTKTKPAHKAKTENKPTLVAFLLDRTGSMSVCKLETIKGFNGYIKELRNKNNGDMRFTLTQFDTIGIDLIHDAVPLKAVADLTDKTYEPRASTPLYDAIGKTIRETEKKAGAKYKVLFVTLTDGEENASSEWTCEGVKALIKEKEDKDHWTFAYIGVGLQGFAASASIAKGTRSASNVLRTTHANAPKDYVKLARVTTAYACSTGNVQCSAKNLWVDTTKPGDDEEETK